MGTPTQNGVVTVGNNETTPLRPESLLCEITKASKSRISETSYDVLPNSYSLVTHADWEPTQYYIFII